MACQLWVKLETALPPVFGKAEPSALQLRSIFPDIALRRDLS